MRQQAADAPISMKVARVRVRAVMQEAIRKIPSSSSGKHRSRCAE
jgi:hypothetical protein